MDTLLDVTKRQYLSVSTTNILWICLNTQTLLNSMMGLWVDVGEHAYRKELMESQGVPEQEFSEKLMVGENGEGLGGDEGSPDMVIDCFVHPALGMIRCE